MPLIVLVVYSLGLRTAHATVLFGLLAAIPDILCIVAVSLLGKEILQHFISRAKSALRPDERFRAGGARSLIFSVAECLLDRLDLLVEVYARWMQICRNAPAFLLRGFSPNKASGRPSGLLVSHD
jgi:hypothetical protein